MPTESNEFWDDAH